MAPGSLTIGNITQNYGGGNSFTTNTAGLMLECSDVTEIAVHDSGTSVHSLMYYSTNGNITIGRDMGWGAANVNIPGTVNGVSITGDIWRKSNMVLYLYRTGTIAGVWSQFLINANLLISEYSRPQVQWRWLIGISTGVSGYGLSWGFFAVIYDQSTGGFSSVRISGSTDIDITQNWDGSGWNRCVITIYNANPPPYINVNIY
jgi:hypothetical protein